MDASKVSGADFFDPVIVTGLPLALLMVPA